MRWMSAFRPRKLLSAGACRCRVIRVVNASRAATAGLDPSTVGGVDPSSTTVEGDEFELPRPGRMRAWQFHDYADLDGLSLASSVRIPTLRNPTDVLVKVHAASVNPVDVKMLGGYGSQVLNTLRKASKLQPNLVEFPIIPGRDFAGDVVDVGRLVRGLKVGDRVYGCPAPHWQGSHAEYVLAPSITIQSMPKSLNYVEAASLPYAFMTMYSALTLFGDFWIRKPSEERVLVVGASGGIGTLAVQTLKAWGSEVAAVCSTDAMDMVESLGADEVYDYTDSSWIETAKADGLFDMVLDCTTAGKSGGPEELNQLVKKWKFGRYITLTPPILRETDERGLFNGAMRLGTDFARSNITSLFSGAKSVRWAFFVPHPRAMGELNSLIQRGQLRPLVEKVYKFQDAPEAYRKVAVGRNRGKIVIAVTTEAETSGVDPSKSRESKKEEGVDANSTNWRTSGGAVGGTLGSAVAGDAGASVGHAVGEAVGGGVDQAAESLEQLTVGVPAGGSHGEPSAEDLAASVGKRADDLFRSATNGLPTPGRSLDDVVGAERKPRDDGNERKS